MQITNILKKRFCRDCNVPLTLYDEPYFTERLKLYGRISNVEEKWSVFLDSLKDYPNEQKYLEFYNNFKDKMIHYIKSKEGWIRFNESDMNQFKTKYTEYSSKNIFKENNDGKYFYSIDMVQANFTSLSYFDSLIFDGADSWEVFLSNFTDNRHLVSSKYIRQVILGACNPKRQVTYEKYLMDQLMDRIVETDLMDKVKVFTNDEIVFQVTETKEVSEIQKILQDYEESGIRLKSSLFKLKRLKGWTGYIQYMADTLKDENFYFTDTLEDVKEIKLKCVNSLEYPFVIRQLFHEPIEENDKVFVYENRLAKFIDSCKFNIE